MRLFSKSKRVKHLQFFIVVSVIATLFFLGYQSYIYSAQDAAFWKLAERGYVVGSERSEYCQKVIPGYVGSFLDSLIYHCIPPDSYSLSALQDFSPDELSIDAELIKQLRQPVYMDFYGVKLKSLEGLNDVSNLVTIRLTNLPNLHNIRSLGTCSNLRSLEISQCPKLMSMEGLSANSRLEHIRITDCSLLEDLTILNEHPSLKSIYLIDLPALTTLTPGSNLKNLEELHLYICPNLKFDLEKWRAINPNLGIMDLR